MQFDRGYISPYMMTNAERMESALEDPHILVTDKKISSIQEILPLLEKVIQSGKKEMVIIADEVDGEALTTLVVNKLRGTFSVLAVKAPGFGDRRKEMLADIATVTGAQFLSDELGRKLESAELHDLGSARRVVSDKDKTTIVAGKGDRKKIDERITQIRAALKTVDSEFDKEKLQERLGKLAGGVAVIKVGAPTESAQKEVKQRVEDAVAATRAAMEEGIVPGGGMALFASGADLRVSENVAEKILGRATQVPLEAIIKNSGDSVDAVMKEIDVKKPWHGFNAVTRKVEDLKSAGILDPLKVTRTALLNAVSVAANYITIGAAVTEIPKKETPPMPGGGMPGMGGMGEY